MKMLQDTVEVQNKTKDAVVRMNRQAVEAEQLGSRTLEELRRQGNQIVSYAVPFLGPLCALCHYGATL